MNHRAVGLYGCCRLLVHSCLLRVASLHYPTQQLSAEVVGLRHLDGLRDVGAGWFGVLKLEPQFSLPCCCLLSVNVVIVVQPCQSKPCLHPLGTEHLLLWHILCVEAMDALQIASVYALCHMLKVLKLFLITACIWDDSLATFNNSSVIVTKHCPTNWSQAIKYTFSSHVAHLILM